MRRLLELQDYVTLQHVRHLLTQSLVYNLLFVYHSWYNLQVEPFLLHDDLSATADLAILLVRASFALALATGLLGLYLHEAHILRHPNHALAFTLWACLCLAAFSSTALASRTVDVSAHIELLKHACVELLERNFHVNFTLRPLHPIVTTSLVPLDLILALLIVDLPLGLVCQHFVGSIYLRELLCSIFITWILIRVILKRSLPEGLLDLRCVSFSAHL